MADLQAAAAMEGSSSRADSVIILNRLSRNNSMPRSPASPHWKKAGPQPANLEHRGAAYLGKKDTVKARESFAQALRLDPKFFPAAANLAQLDLKDKQPANARKRFEDILKADPKHLNAMLSASRPQPEQPG